MRLTNKQFIQDILTHYKIKPNKSFGQNFLIDQDILDRILVTAGLKEKDLSAKILEIGPGIGTLTAALIEQAGLVVSVEADREMVGILQKILDKPSNLTIVPTAIQHFRRQDYFADGEYKVVANIPYNVSSYLLNDYLQNSPKPSEIVLMVQKEVAQRAIAKPGDSERSLLSLVVEIFSTKAEIIQIVPPSAFWPSPKVESAIIRITVDHNVDMRYGASVQSILKIAKVAFSQRRKKISNSLPAEIISKLSTNKIDPNLRPQDLTLEQWKKIANYSNYSNSPNF